MNLYPFRADLHVHTCLSPCADLQMSPRNIVYHALRVGLDIVAVSDHNTAQNAGAVMSAAADSPLIVLPAMEISSLEEVHVLAVFPDVAAAEQVQEVVYQHLSRSEDSPHVQDQVIASARDEVEGFCPYLLIGATSLSLRQTVDLIHLAGGIAIAAHIDRQAFGVIGQLGFIPPRVRFDALEISKHCSFDACRTCYAENSSYVFLTGSDAHILDDLGTAWVEFQLQEPSFDEIKRALMGENGRAVAPHRKLAGESRCFPL